MVMLIADTETRPCYSPRNCVNGSTMGRLNMRDMKKCGTKMCESESTETQRRLR